MGNSETHLTIASAGPEAGDVESAVVAVPAVLSMIAGAAEASVIIEVEADYQRDDITVGSSDQAVASE